MLNEYFHPKKTLKLIGHEKKLSFFVELINENKFPKVLLLSGDKGIGKFTLINHLMFSYFDQKNYDLKNFKILESSSFYKKILQNIFPNIIYLQGSDFKNIKIEDIRKLKYDLQKSPIYNDKRFIILDDVETFNLNSLNGLLKIIEDPGTNNYFIMINNKSQLLLDTIKSRSIEMKILLSNEQRNKIFSFLLENFEQRQLFEGNVINVSPGNLLKFNYLTEINNININDKFSNGLNKILNLYKKDKNLFYKDFLLFFTEYYLKKNKSKIFLDEKTFIEKRSFLIRNISNFFSFNLNQNTFLNSIQNQF